MEKKLVIKLLLILIVPVSLLAFKNLQSSEATPQEKEEAIRQAQNYQTDDVCTQALVSAVHKKTGAKYTFSSGCLAPGWEPEK